MSNLFHMLGRLRFFLLRRGGRLVSEIVAVSLFGLCAHANAQVNTNCAAPAGQVMSCSMPTTAGTYSYQIDGSTATAVQLINNTGASMQINQVVATQSFPAAFGDLCTYRNIGQTQQTSPGIGEVGCTSKLTNEANFPPVLWTKPGVSTVATGLAMSPGDSLYVQDSLQNPTGAAFHQNTFAVTIAPQTTGIISVRTPRADQTIACTGAQQWTTWGPWQNTTGQNEYYLGATIYATSPTGKNVQTACIYTIGTDGSTIVKQSCTSANEEGQLVIPPATVAPGQYIGGQATNICSSPGVWDWVGYVWMYY